MAFSTAWKTITPNQSSPSTSSLHIEKLVCIREHGYVRSVIDRNQRYKKPHFCWQNTPSYSSTSHSDSIWMLWSNSCSIFLNTNCIRLFSHIQMNGLLFLCIKYTFVYASQVCHGGNATRTYIGLCPNNLKWWWAHL